MTIEIPWVVVLAGRALAVLTAAGAVIGLLVGIVLEVVRRG